MTVPGLSPKIPPLPTGAPCIQALYTMTQIVPTVKVDYVSPLEGPDLRENLGLESTFTLSYVDSKVGKRGLGNTAQVVQRPSTQAT